MKGALIHIEPDMLPVAYGKIHQASLALHPGRRGRQSLARVDRYRLMSTGCSSAISPANSWTATRISPCWTAHWFAYRRDPAFPQDDVTWFLLEKTR